MVPFTSVSIVDGMWRFTWGNGWGVVRVVLWGVLIEETEETEFFYPASSMHASLITAPPIEVVPGGDYRGLLWSDGIELLFDGVSLTWFNPVPQTAISERNLPYIRLQWYRVPCSHYVIEVNNNGTWQLHSTRSDTPDIFIQTFITQILEDQVEWLWRVTALAFWQ